MFTLDSRGIQPLSKRPDGEIQRCVWYPQHHREDRGPEEPVQRTGGRSAEADVLRLGPCGPVRHHEADLRRGVGQYVTKWVFKQLSNKFYFFVGVQSADINTTWGLLHVTEHIHSISIHIVKIDHFCHLTLQTHKVCDASKFYRNRCICLAATASEVRSFNQCV